MGRHPEIGVDKRRFILALVASFPMRDREIVERQLGRAPRAFRRVTVRCPFGRPAVTEQAPFDNDGTPFPTQFWLTCSHLAKQLARLEAAGGVERWSAAARADP